MESGSVCPTSLHRVKDGRIAVRLLETAGKECDTRIRLPEEIQKAYLSDVTEEKRTPIPIKDGIVTFLVRPFEILTIILE